MFITDCDIYKVCIVKTGGRHICRGEIRNKLTVAVDFNNLT